MASSGGSPVSFRDFLSGSSELGALLRAMDWSCTKLGPIEGWPQSLRTSVSTCLNSRFAILIWWGPDLIMLYNDAYRDIIASKHPAALGNPGRECWPEIWDTIGPMLDGVMQRGEATWSDDLLLMLARHGYPEECYFTFSYSPISDESGGIGGVFTPVMETTERVIGERRSNMLRELAGLSVEGRSEEHVWSLAAEVLGRNRLDISFAVLYSLSPERRHVQAKNWTGISPDHVLCQPERQLNELQSPLLKAVGDALHSGKTVLVSDLEKSYPDLPLGVWGIAPVEAVTLPVTFPGQSSPQACLLIGLNARKRFDQNYASYLETLARQFGSNLAAARAHEEETRRAEMLAELDRAKTVFFSNVSHEFRTPLTLMVGPIETMLDRARPTATTVTREELQLVHRNSMRLLKLVNTLLDFSRIEAGRAEAFYEPTDLATFTADTASAFRSAMEQAGLEFKIDCEHLSEPAYVDRDMWEKVILNLISNAFKFTLVGGVTVRLSTIGEGIELRVEDTGLGIPEDQQSKVFERFHRLEGIRGRTHEGTGIGLALVQELVKLHRGTIRLESIVGKGSSFVVTIPRGSAHLSAERLASQPRVIKSTGVSASAYVDEALRWLPEQGEHLAEPVARFAADSVLAPHVQTTSGRILLADDNADMRGYVRRLLGDNYEVQAVSNGREALLAVRDNPPDLVLTDVMMPEIDGFGLLRELRADEKANTIPIILLSARAGEDARIEGMQAGADDYMVKPFTARELLARVGAHLAMGRLRREAAEHERALRAEAEDIATALEESRKELEHRVQERTAELQLANDELRELSSRLQQLQDEERRRIARGLHDSAGQLLAGVAMNMAVVKGEVHKLSANAARCVQDNFALIDQLTSEIRTISHLLHPPLLDEVGLASALRWYVDGFSQRSKIAATLEMPEDLQRFPDDTEIAIFRAVQECLTNVHRHSGSRSCWLRLVQDAGNLLVEVRDDGKGIPSEKRLTLMSSGGGVGLRGMQERIRKLGGTLAINSSSRGTTVAVTLPIHYAVARYREGAA
jgi:signal transduction histidine kinase